MTDKLDEFHQHEAMHTAHVVMETWAVHVQDHPWVVADDKLSGLADAATEAMMALYQAMGADDE